MKNAIANAIIIVLVLLPVASAQFVSGGFSDGFTQEGFGDGFIQGGFDSQVIPSFDTAPAIVGFQPSPQPAQPAPGSFDSMPPGFDSTIVITPDNPLTAVWNALQDIVIPQASPDGTIVYPHITSQCHDSGNQFLQFTIESTSPHYSLSFLNEDLVINDLNPSFVGSETITLACNGVPASFLLTVRASQDDEPEKSDDQPRIRMRAIVPDSAALGNDISIIVILENSGHKKIKDVTVSVYMPELGIKAPRKALFDLNPNKISRTNLLIELPDDITPGTYAVLIAVDANDLHRRLYREIEIV